MYVKCLTKCLISNRCSENSLFTLNALAFAFKLICPYHHLIHFLSGSPEIEPFQFVNNILSLILRTHLASFSLPIYFLKYTLGEMTCLKCSGATCSETPRAEQSENMMSEHELCTESHKNSERGKLTLLGTVPQSHNVVYSLKY